MDIKRNNNYYNELKELLNNCRPDLTKVKVAAIIVTDKGVFKGVNFEDIICSLSMCAERSAIYAGLAYGMKHIYEIHIMSNLENITMCGACRQLAWTFHRNGSIVFTYNLKTKERKRTKLTSLLPSETAMIDEVDDVQ